MIAAPTVKPSTPKQPWETDDADPAAPAVAGIPGAPATPTPQTGTDAAPASTPAQSTTSTSVPSNPASAPASAAGPSEASPITQISDGAGGAVAVPPVSIAPPSVVPPQTPVTAPPIDRVAPQPVVPSTPVAPQPWEQGTSTPAPSVPNPDDTGGDGLNAQLAALQTALTQGKTTAPVGPTAELQPWETGRNASVSPTGGMAAEPNVGNPNATAAGNTPAQVAVAQKFGIDLNDAFSKGMIEMGNTLNPLSGQWENPQAAAASSATQARSAALAQQLGYGNDPNIPKGQGYFSVDQSTGQQTPISAAELKQYFQLGPNGQYALTPQSMQDPALMAKYGSIGIQGLDAYDPTQAARATDTFQQTGGSNTFLPQDEPMPWEAAHPPAQTPPAGFDPGPSGGDGPNPWEHDPVVNTSSPPATTPPATNPPSTNPPATTPPVQNPPSTTPPPTSSVGQDSFSDDSNLISTQVNPALNARQLNLDNMTDAEVQKLLQGPDRLALAKQYIASSQGDYDHARQDATDDAAYGGYLKSGRLTNKYGDLDTTREANISKLLTDAAGATIGDNQNNLTAVRGVGNDAYTRSANDRSEIRGERTYQENLADQAIQRRILQQELESQHDQQDFNNATTLYKLGNENDPQSAEQYAAALAAAQASGNTQSVADLIRMMTRSSTTSG